MADYMADCLLHPDLGYYTTRDPLGVAGDFTTAPEISQMFGELLGLALAVGAATLGLIMFGERPDMLTLLGAVLIVGSGLYMMWREQQLKRRGGQPAGSSIEEET